MLYVHFHVVTVTIRKYQVQSFSTYSHIFTYCEAPYEVSGCVAPSPSHPKLRRPNLTRTTYNKIHYKIRILLSKSKSKTLNDLLHENSLMK